MLFLTLFLWEFLWVLLVSIRKETLVLDANKRQWNHLRSTQLFHLCMKYHYVIHADKLDSRLVHEAKNVELSE